MWSSAAAPLQLYPALTSSSCSSPEATLATQSWIQVFWSSLTENGVDTDRKTCVLSQKSSKHYKGLVSLPCKDCPVNHGLPLFSKYFVWCCLNFPPSGPWISSAMGSAFSPALVTRPALYTWFLLLGTIQVIFQRAHQSRLGGLQNRFGVVLALLCSGVHYRQAKGRGETWNF